MPESIGDTPKTEPFNFTPKTIRDAKLKEGQSQTFYRDLNPKAPGLGLRVTASKKVFVFEARLKQGKPIRVSLGNAESMILDDARKRAREYQGWIDEGRDPRAILKELSKKDEETNTREGARAATVGDAWAAYIKYQKDKMTRVNLERGKKWGERHLLDHERMTQPGGQPKARGKGKTKPGVLVPLMGKKLSAIDSDLLAEWVSKEQKTRANAARQGFEAFRAFWRWCATHKDYKAVIDDSVVESKELRDNVPSRKTTGQHEDVLEASHLPAWFEGVRGLSNPVLSAYLQGLLITGARREELAQLKWADIEFQWSAICLHDKVDKTGERMIPLTPYFRSLLESLPRRNEWVFSSPSSESGRITEPRISHNRALDAAGLPHVTLHGLRRSFLTLSEWVEMPQGIVSQIVGHKPSATAERHYKRRPLDLLALWHTKLEAWFLERAGIQFVATPTGKKLIAIK